MNTAGEKEGWSWLKFFKGFFDGKNYAKSIVFLVCSSIIIVVCYSTFTVVKSKFAPKTQSVETNNGTISTTNTQKGNTWSLLNLFNIQ